MQPFSVNISTRWPLSKVNLNTVPSNILCLQFYFLCFEICLLKLSTKDVKQVCTRETKKLQELHGDLKIVPKGRINLHVNRNVGAAIVSVRTIILSDNNRVTAITGSFSLGNLHKCEDYLFDLFGPHSSLSTDSC